MIYIGSGRAPQGGNVNNGQVTDMRTLATHALCRPGDYNVVQDPSSPDLDAKQDSVVMKEDFDAHAIASDKIFCGVGDFQAGSCEFFSIFC